MGRNNLEVEIQRLEARLRESEERFRAFSQASKEGIAFHEKGVIVDLNQAFADLVGYEREELMGTNGLDLASPESRPELDEWIRSRSNEPLDVLACRKDGSTFPGRVWIREVSFQGRTARVTLCEDISKEKRAEEEYRALFEASRDAIFWADPESGQVVRCNRAAERLLEKPRAEIIGSHQRTVHPPEKAAYYEEMFRRHIENRNGLDEEVEVLAASGKRKPVQIAATVARVGGKDLIQGVFRDLTEIHKAEEERAKLEASMQQAQKLESLGVLAGGLAHDFNNLLMGMLGNADLALMTLAQDDPAREQIEQVEIAARRAADLTNHLLAYSGRGRFMLQPLDLSSLVEEMVSLLGAVISKGSTLEVDLSRNLPKIEGDAAQVKQIVMNLITNASDAIENRTGSISISTAVVEADSALLQTSFLHKDIAEGRYVVVEVSDTGSGMDEQTREQMFDPFFTTRFTGRGLGLAAVLGIVRGHKGAILVNSAPGEGTTVKILFPASEAERKERPVGQQGNVDGSGNGLVLVVDDEEIVRSTTRSFLKVLGYSVLVANDGLEAIELAKERAGELSLVLLDMTMPRLGGVETCVELKKIRPDLPVILSSGYDVEAATSRFTGDEGFDGFIQKPYKLRKLSEVVMKVLRFC